MDMKSQTVCFTGHRNIPADELPALKKTLVLTIEQYINMQLHYFYCGGARGFDMLAGFTVLSLKKHHPQAQLIMVLPCRDQDVKWNDVERAQYRELLETADLTVCLSETYYKGCMLRRNQYLVDHSMLCLAYLKYPHTGTAQTVRLAKERGLIVHNLADIRTPADA